MATMINAVDPRMRAFDARDYYVIHPLDDAPEEKCNPDDLGPMPMSPVVKASLYTLRGYLVLMIGLALYHFLSVAGLFVHHVS
jgi:hypothetical protein